MKENITLQLEDVIKYDNETKGPWPEYDAACRQLLDLVIPKLLGALQIESREIKPALIHGDLCENNVVPIMRWNSERGGAPGRSTSILQSMRLYQRHVEPSEPVEEWDDRNRLYSIRPYLNDSAGHPGSVSRQLYA